ncbi:Predicted signal transduction protein containing sensor and EAL domains [Enterobacter cloacae]|uniref:Predicted signal transduction protein containing sensor and EAL domains n=1 Tax=Enterobacter cloacae TaxID=550 RepID=A0A377M1U7_ENTCL|nr:Predicted signal transduction protein containing sensor and EAL domains [Enterobacter cloacae]
MKKIIAVAIVSTILVILSLYAVNAVIISQQKDKQREIARRFCTIPKDYPKASRWPLKR